MTPAALRHIRDSLGLSQKAFGRALGYRGANVGLQVSYMERGLPKAPISRHVWRLAVMFHRHGVPKDFLAGKDEAKADH